LSNIKVKGRPKVISFKSYLPNSHTDTHTHTHTTDRTDRLLYLDHKVVSDYTSKCENSLNE